MSRSLLWLLVILLSSSSSVSAQVFSYLPKTLVAPVGETLTLPQDILGTVYQQCRVNINGVDQCTTIQVVEGSQLILPNGTVAAPGQVFSDGQGWYRQGSNSIGLAIAGNVAGRVDQTNTIWGYQAGPDIVGLSNVVMGVRAAQAGTTMLDNTCIGRDACLTMTDGEANTCVGEDSCRNVTAGVSFNSAFGTNSMIDLTSGTRNSGFGQNTGGNLSTGSWNTFIGYGARVTGGGGNFTGVVVIGANAFATASNQLLIGGNTDEGRITQAVIGRGVTSTTPGSLLFTTTNASGEDVAGGSLQIAPGRGTGSAAPGLLTIATSPVGTTGTTLNALEDNWFFTPNTLVQRRGTAAQALWINNTYTDDDNQVRWGVDWQSVSNVARVGVVTAATGTSRAMRLVSQTSNAGNSYATVQVHGSTAPFVHIDRPTSGFTVASTTTTGSFFQVGPHARSVATTGSISYFAILPTYDQPSGDAANTDLLINRTQTNVGSGAQLLIDAQVGGSSQFSVSNTGVVSIGGSAGVTASGSSCTITAITGGIITGASCTP